MGGPPGARSGIRRRAYPHNWELRDPARYGERFVEELESDENDGHGVTLDPNGYALREARQRGFRGDELYFDGYDLDRDGTPTRGVYNDAYYDDYISGEEEYLQQQGARYQAPVRDKQDSLLQTALDRIARAKEKGKTNVNLSREEMDALSAGRSQQLEPPLNLASPPATPAKSSKIKASSRQSSTGSLAGQKTRKKSTSGFFGSPAKSTSKAKTPRKNSVDHAPPYPSTTAPPGIMIPGPDGRPVWTPITYGPPSPEMQRAQPVVSRSSSKHRRREPTPPEQLPTVSSRYPGMRPESSGSNRSMQDELDWYGPPLRTRSASNARYGRYPPPDDYDMAPPMPAAHGRRNVSGPPDVRYANWRRQTPGGSPLAPRAQPDGGASPVAARASSESHGSALRRVETSSSDSSEGQGVQVEVVSEENGRYSVSRESPPAERTSSGTPTKAGAEARRRKSGLHHDHYTASLSRYDHLTAQGLGIAASFPMAGFTGRGRGRGRLPRGVIEALPDHTTPQTTTSNPLPSKRKFLASLEPEGCPICYGPITKPVRTACGHNFCIPCAKTWFQEKNSCPTCRRELYKKELQRSYMMALESLDDDDEAVLDRRALLPGGTVSAGKSLGSGAYWREQGVVGTGYVTHGMETGMRQVRGVQTADLQHEMIRQVRPEIEAADRSHDDRSPAEDATRVRSREVNGPNSLRQDPAVLFTFAQPATSYPAVP